MRIIVNLSLFAGLVLSHEYSHNYETTMDEDAPKPMRILEFTIRNLATDETFSHADGLGRAHRALRSSDQDPFEVKIRTADSTFDIKVQKQSAADSVFGAGVSIFVNRGTYKEKVPVPVMTVLNNPNTFDLLSLQEGGDVTGSVVRNGQAFSVFTDPNDNQLKLVQDGKFQGCSRPLTPPDDGLDPNAGSGGRMLNDEEVVQPKGNMRRRTQNAARWTNCYPDSDKPHEMVIGLALTSTLMQARGNSASAAATWAGQMVVEANQIYRAQTNIKLTIGAIEMAGPGNNLPWDNPGCNNRNFFSQTGQGMGAQLAAVRTWPKPKANMATWHVMDDCAWKAIELSRGGGFTNGIAYLGTLCNDGAVGVNYCGRDCGTDKPRSRYGTWKVFAHEMGHNFGAWHPFHAHEARPPLILNPRPQQGAAGGIMDYGNGLYQGKFQFNSNINQGFVCTYLNRVNRQCKAKNAIRLDTGAANPNPGVTTAKPTQAATTNAATSCAAYLASMVNIGKTNPQAFPGFQQTTGVTTATATVNDYQRYVKCRGLLQQQCQGLQFPSTCSKPACNVCQIVPPGQAGKCVCSGVANNGLGGQGCTSTDTQPDGSVKAWCYTAKSVCTDGKASSTVNGDWSYLACQATTKSPAATPAPVAKCTDTPGWTDKDGDACSEYNSCANGGWKAKDANYYDRWANNGVSARQACCACGKGAPETAGCKDYPNWKNTQGYDCAAYKNYFAACDRFGNQADANGVTANQACCVCKSAISGLGASSAVSQSVDAVKFENFMNKERFKDQDPQCLTGLKAGQTCCARECGRCQANGCSALFSGSSDKCCPGQIKRSCETNPPPCVTGGVVTVTLGTGKETTRPSMFGDGTAGDVDSGDGHAPLALLQTGLTFAVAFLLC